MGNDEPHPEAQQPQHVQDVQAQQVQAVGRAELWIAIGACAYCRLRLPA